MAEATPKMAEAELFGIAKSVLRRLASPALNEFRLLWGYKEQFQRLEDTIRTINDVLEDADRKQATDATVRGWLARLSVVLYDADDLFDAISAEVLLEKNKKDTKLGKKVRHIVSKPNRLAFYVKNAQKVKEIRERFDDIARDYFHTQPLNLKLKWPVMWLWDKKKPIKWMFILLNVGLELCQATFSEEAGDGKIKGSQYRKLAVIFSAICLTLPVAELAQEGWTDGVKLTRNRGCYCFHYPGEDGRIFGRFPQWFGLASAAVQFNINLASLVKKRGVLKFDQLGLLLSVGYFFLALLGERTMVAKVRCNVHGTNEAEGQLVKGTWEFSCHKCPPENMV